MTGSLEWLFEHIEAQDNPTTLGRLRAVADELERLRAEVATLMDGMERAWGIIANGRAWDPVHHDEWEAAKFAWRDDHWHPSLARNVSGDAPEQGGDQ